MKKNNPKPKDREENHSNNDEPEIYAIKKETTGIKLERRDFLIKLGLLTSAAAAGCNDVNNKTIPVTPGKPEIIPQNIKAETCENLNAHSDTVNWVCFSPDGKLLASAGTDNAVKLWSVTESKLLKTLQEHTASVSTVCFNPDGSILASGGSDNLIRLWSIPEGQLLKNLEGHADTISSVCFTPDGKVLVSGSFDNTIKLWSVPEGQLLKTLEGHTKAVDSVSVSRDGTRIASGSSDKSLKIWSLADGEILKSSDENDSWIGSVMFSPDGKLLASCSANIIKIWSLPGGKMLNSLEGHSQVVNSVCFSPDGTKLVSGSDDMTIRLWSVADSKLILTSKGHSGNVRSVSFSPDGNRIASCGNDKTLKLWDLSSYPKIEPDGTFQDSTSDQSPPYAESADKIAFRNFKGKVQVFDVKSNSVTSTVKVRSYLSSIALSNDSRYLIIGNYSGLIKWWDLENKKEQNKFNTNKSEITGIYLKKDNKQIITSDRSGSIDIWSFPQNEFLRTFLKSSDTVNSFCISSDEKHLAFHSLNTVQIWSLDTFSRVKSISESSSSESYPTPPDTLAGNISVEKISYSGFCNFIRFAPGSTKLIIGTSASCYIYDYLKDSITAKFVSEDTIISFSVSDDEKYLAIGYRTRGIEIRSFSDLSLLKSIGSIGANIQRLVFLGENNKLVVYTESVIRVYQITDFVDDIILTTCLFDKSQLAEETKGIQYNIGSTSMTLPCGTPIPADAVCTCNCITIGSPATYSNTYYYTYYYTYWYPN